MARKAARSKARRSASRATPAPAGTPRERIIQAFMSLLAEHPIERIGLAEIAERAGVTLADMRGEFGSPLAVLAAHVKELDRKVLAEVDSDMAEESPRERLFDVLMRRLELLGPHREAVRSLLRSARRDPPLALALNGMAVRSQQWMLTAAGIGAAGPKGMIRSQGARAPVRQRAAKLGRRRRGQHAHARGARPRAGARPALRRSARRPLSDSAGRMQSATADAGGPPRAARPRGPRDGLKKIDRSCSPVEVCWRTDLSPRENLRLSLPRLAQRGRRRSRRFETEQGAVPDNGIAFGAPGGAGLSR